MGGLTVSIQSEIKWLSFNGDLRPYEHCESSYTELYLLPFWLSLTNTVSEANPNNKLMMRRAGLSILPFFVTFTFIIKGRVVTIFHEIFSQSIHNSDTRHTKLKQRKISTGSTNLLKVAAILLLN